MSRIFKSERINSYPPALYIEPASYCNYRCPMCARNHKAAGNTNGYMDFDLFKKMIDEMAEHIYFLLIFGYGEPFLNRDLLKMIRLAKQHDLFVVLGTNGSLLTKEKVDEMMEDPPDMIVFSLDSLDEETYKKYRTGGDLKSVLDNIRYLSEQRLIRGKKTPLIEIQFLAMKDNLESIRMASTFVKQIGADSYSIKRVSAYYGKSGLSNVDEFLPTHKSEFIYSIYKDSSAPISSFCSYPWRQFTVNWDGKVIPCCKDIDAVHTVGNAFQGKLLLMEIWNSEEFRSFRRQVKTNIDGIEMCKGCTRRVEEEVFLDQQGTR